MIAETLGSLLHHCSKIKALRYGISLHAIAFKIGFQSDVVVSNHIINIYAKCGNLTSARQVFDEMPERNLVSWSALISGYDQLGEPLLALRLFSRMPFLPNEFLFSSLIASCASLTALLPGQQLHAMSLKHGYGFCSFVSNSLITMYMKCTCCSDAFLVFAAASEHNSISYNALIAGFVENRLLEKGFEMFKLMHQQGLPPDRFSFGGLLGSCDSRFGLHTGMMLHCQTIKLVLDSTPFVGNVIMTMYSNFNLLCEVEKAFRLIGEKDVISWNTYITACSLCEDHCKGLSGFAKMLNENDMKPDNFTFSVALACCAGLASMRHGKEIHAYLLRTRLDQDIGVGNALMNMYAKCALIRYAYVVFCNMRHCDLVSWNTIIVGLGNHGLGLRAVELFGQMVKVGLKPDSITFVGLLTACNHAGLVDQGISFFKSMEGTYSIAPDIEHFSCLIDMLGRAGRLNDAAEFMKSSPFERDPIIIGSLLSACRLHGNLELGEHLANQLLKLKPVTTSPYVLLSNLYASDKMWDCVAESRRALKKSKLKKEPAYSSVEVQGNFEKFTIGDYSHERMEEIEDMLKILTWEMEEISASL